MKNKNLFTCIVALALLSGCIKDEGDIMTIVRPDVVVGDKDTKNTDLTTVVTEEGGYMEAMSPKDSIVKNSFETTINDYQIENLNCYTILHSEFKNINTTRNGIKEVGFVYSRSNKVPVITDKQNCVVLSVKKDVSSSDQDVEFEGKIEGLDFNSTYFVRSYAICEGDGKGKSDSVIYNSRPLEYKTVLPSDVWYQRKPAPDKMMSRTNAFCCNNGDDVYVYGGQQGTMRFNDLWKYDTSNDTWQQMGTFENENGHTGPARRSNGAMIAYPNPNPEVNDVLLFVIGGECGTNGEYTGTIFYYSTAENRFADNRDHPNARNEFVVHDDEGHPLYEVEYEKDENGNYKYDADNNKIVARDANGKIKYVLGPDGNPKELTTHSSRSYIEELPIYKDLADGSRIKYGIAGCVAFSLTDRGFTKYFVAFGKTDMSNDGQKHVSTSIYEYVPQNDWDRQGSDRYSYAWESRSTNSDKTAEGFYQPICIRCGDRVVIGTGESSRNNGELSRNFYTLTYSVNSQSISMTPLQANDVFNDSETGFKPRANAASFYLNFTRDGINYDRMYVGTGRTCSESDFDKNPDPTKLLNDFWCYDFVSKQWSRKADCSSTVVRQGAVGFTVNRLDDYLVRKFGDVENMNIRGMFSFGEGYDLEGYKTLSDNWEYIP